MTTDVSGAAHGNQGLTGAEVDSIRLDPYDFIADAERAVAERNGGSARGLAAILAMERAVKLVQAQAAPELRELGLTYAGWQALTALSYSKHRALPIARIAKRLGAHPTTITTTIDRLERAGYVERERLDHDRRLVMVKLTDLGADIERQATSGRSERSFGVPVLDEEELALLSGLLQKVRLALGDLWQDERAGP